MRRPLEVTTGERCDRMPRGWRCYLERGHGGPCPGWPTTWTRFKHWVTGRWS